MFKTVRNFVRGVKNIIAYAPILYHDRDFDYEYMLRLLRKKLERMADYFANANIVVSSASIAKEIVNINLELELLEDVLTTLEGGALEEEKLKKIFTEIGEKITHWWD